MNNSLPIMDIFFYKIYKYQLLIVILQYNNTTDYGFNQK